MRMSWHVCQMHENRSSVDVMGSVRVRFTFSVSLRVRVRVGG